MFKLNISVNENKILGQFLVDSYFFELSKYEYAYYLYKDGEKIDTIWYTKNLEAVFPVENLNGVFYIRIFIRDIEHGDKRTYDSEKITVDSE